MTAGDCGNSADIRKSALWGKGSREGGARNNALWGKGGRNLALLAVLILSLLVPGAAQAGSYQNVPYVPQYLLDRAEQNPVAKFHVIVLAAPGVNSGKLKNDVMKDSGNQFGQVRHEFSDVIDALAVTITGRDLLLLAKKNEIESITPDAGVKATSLNPAELWPFVIGADKLWAGSALGRAQLPTIAIVDSGVDPDRVADFGGRIVQHVSFSSRTPDQRKDDLGHGTIVTRLAAGGATAYPGVAPTARIVSLRVLDKDGGGVTSDVLKAIEWIYKNRDSYGIRVANFSLTSPYASWGLRDPLNTAVRQLWLSGTVVVTSAGNLGPGQMLYAPASDPFVITVGAVDINNSLGTDDDSCPAWSSRGYTADGFAKPELGAPGRYMVGPMLPSSTLTSIFGNRIVAPGYMWMSGSSFATPLVAGAAAQILARNPRLTPDQVKGALMLTARHLPSAEPRCAGVGEIDAAAAAQLTNPPNANENLFAFVEDRNGRKVFDARKWADAVSANANWTSANWASANWTTANWVASNWTSSQWSAANWTNSNWTSSNWTNSNWTSANWTAANWVASIASD